MNTRQMNLWHDSNMRLNRKKCPFSEGWCLFGFFLFSYPSLKSKSYSEFSLKATIRGIFTFYIRNIPQYNSQSGSIFTLLFRVLRLNKFYADGLWEVNDNLMFQFVFCALKLVQKMVENTIKIIFSHNTSIWTNKSFDLFFFHFLFNSSLFL